MKVLDIYRSKLFFKLFYWAMRIALGLTFIISGTRKLPGVKFTQLPIDDPVGFYFTAMHESGFYWNFIGYFQIVLGVLIFINRFVVITGLLMMPITINIFLISVSLNMRGTPIITALMLLANTFLLLWNYENYMSLLKRPLMKGKS